MAEIVQKEKDGFIETIERNGNQITVRISRQPPKGESRMASLLSFAIVLVVLAVLLVLTMEK